MKKIKILIPSLVLTTVAPVISLSSCGQDKNVSYLEISETGKTMVKVIVAKNKKDLLAPETFPHTLDTYYNRATDYMETSTDEEIAKVKEDTNFGETEANRFVRKGEWTDHVATYTVTPKDNEYQRVVFFLHGGAYAKNIQYSHIKTCLQLSEKLNAKFYIPLYPVMPQHRVDECYSFIRQSYNEMCSSEPNKDIIFMGDSSGAGLALGFSQLLYAEKVSRQPSARVLFSPWVDVTMKNKQIDDYFDRDIMLHPYGLSFYGRLWADIKDDTKEDWSVDDYRISPINGEMDDKIKTLNVVGSEEIFYPDVRLLHKKLLDGGCDSHLIIANGLFHDFETFSDLPAAQLGWKEIPEVIELYDKVAEFLNK